MKIDKKKSIFLLGGYDLEMVTIKELLLKQGFKENKNLFDKKLSWGAKLSDYKEEIEQNSNKTFYAVELKIDEDDEFYKKHEEKIKIIDHHNKYIDNPTSLEQVLELLEIEDKLSNKTKRHYELISANDKGYINALKCVGASEEEIEEIRKKDREAQGVTKEDYEKVKELLSTFKPRKNINFVKATTQKFTAIMDVLYFEIDKEKRKEKTIICNDKEISCYRFDLGMLKGIAREFKLDKDDYYFGGGTTGYFGTSFDNKENMKKFVKLVVKKNNLQSSHIFMFPFKFDYMEKSISDSHKFDFYYENSIDERINLDILHKKLQKDDWEYDKYTISENHRIVMYNENRYFRDYVKDCLYNHKEFNEGAISSFYRKKPDLYRHEEYIIDIIEKGCGEYRAKAQTYKLEIEDITLRVFQTGVAILAIELNNYRYEKLDDILRINDYGRRVYPQFIGEDGILTTKQNFLANYIQIGNDEREDFRKYNLRDVDVKIGNHIKTVLGEKTFTDSKKDKEKFYIQPSLDDRMYVLCWYGNKEFSENVKRFDAYKYLDDWYKYIFVDNGEATVKNSDMKQKLLEDASYPRWSEYSTIFGITGYSFMALTDGGDFSKFVIGRHMHSMYFQMATLLLTNRTSVLRFFDEATSLLTKSQSELDKSLEEHSTKIQRVQNKFDIYDNRVYFKELTDQTQGIELFLKGLEQMRIIDNHDELEKKFTRLSDNKKMLADDVSADAMNRLSVLGALFLPVSFIISIFGLGIFDFDKASSGFDTVMFVSILLSLIIPVGIISFSSSSIIKIIKKDWLKLALLLTSMALIVAISYSKYPTYIKDNDINKTKTTIKNNTIEKAKDLQKIKRSITPKKEENNATAKHPVSGK